jgi:hypothetical protein
MNTFLDRLLQSKLNFCFGLLAIAVPSGGSTSVDFSQLITHAPAYKGKRVSVTGVAEVNGISFVLFEPPRRDLSQKIFVGQKLGPPRYDHLNNHWVNVTGIVDTDEEKVFACKIFLEKVRPLDRPPVKGVDVYGVFFNEGPETVQLELFNKAGNESTEITLPPGGIDRMVIAEGLAKVYTPSESFFSGKLLSSCPVPSETSAREFFEQASRTFYFQIRNGKITLLHPRNATILKKRWQALEKHR